MAPMRSLEPPDAFFAAAAEGWLELGNVAEARAELARVSKRNQNHPDALEIRWTLCAAEADWSAALEVARAQLEKTPDDPAAWLHLAYALRRAPGGGLAAASDALLPALDKFPKEPVVPYNLACYACQSDRLDVARIFYQRAVSIGGVESIKQMALQDPDLEPLWAEIKGM